MLSLSTLIVKLIISRLIALNRRGHNITSDFFLNVRSVFQNIRFEAFKDVGLSYIPVCGSVHLAPPDDSCKY